jgi:MFS family permease
MLVYYSTIIFANIGLSPFLSQLLAAVMNTCFALGTFLLPPTIERLGRRRIMLGGAVACTVLMLIFVIMVGLPHQNMASQWTAVAAVIAFIFVFGYSWIGTVWLYGAEVRSPATPRHDMTRC